MRILLTRKHGGLGDVLCLLPAVAALRAEHPDATLDLALPAEYAGLLRGRLDGVRVLAWDHRRFQPRWRRLLDARYDRILDLARLQNSPQAGLHPPHAAECSAAPPAGRPAVPPWPAEPPNRIDGFADACGVRLDEPVPRLVLTPGETRWAAAWLGERGIGPSDRPVACLHLKSARPAKDWPLDKFRRLARRLIDRDVRVVTLERSLRIDTPGIVGAHGLSLPRVAVLIAACDVLVGPDSGPMHLAAAVGTPAVALFGPTDPGVILRHYRATHVAIRRPNVADIPVADVLEAINRSLECRPNRGTGVSRVISPRPGRACHPEIRDRRVLFVSDKVYPDVIGGAEISMHLLLGRLRERGCQTHVRTWQKNSTADLGELIRSAEPDWVFTRGPVAPAVAREAKHQGRRVAVFVSRLADLRQMVTSADVISCNSDYIRRVIERVFTADGTGRSGNDAYGPRSLRARLVVQYPLVEEPRSTGRMRRRYLTIISPSPATGQRLFEQLARRLDDRRFLVLGGGDLDLPWDRVAFLPTAVRMDEVYRATRILLRPAVRIEAFGRTVAEAAAFGVPAVVSRQGGLPEALGPGGVAVRDFQNPDAWVRAIDRVEQDYDEYARRALEHAKTFRSIAPILGAMARAEERPPRPARPPRRPELCLLGGRRRPGGRE